MFEYKVYKIGGKLIGSYRYLSDIAREYQDVTISGLNHHFGIKKKVEAVYKGIYLIKKISITSKRAAYYRNQNQNKLCTN